MSPQNQSSSKNYTIYDIAREANVSASTVSRVLSGTVNVREDTKKRVLSIIEQHNFKPNALAQGLSDTKTKTIGILTVDVRNPYYSTLFVACETAAQKAGYSVYLSNSFDLVEREIEQLENFYKQKTAAVIQLGGRVDEIIAHPLYLQKINNLTASGMPFITTGKLDGSEVFSVMVSSKQSAALLIEHLISYGHKKIAMIGGYRNITSTYEQYITYVNILRKYNIPFNENYFYEGKYKYETGYNGMNHILDHNRQRPTAVIAVNDICACGVLQSIKEHGLRIPEDISVVSYDNTYLSMMTTPKLTSIDYNYELYGQMLFDTALARIQGKEIPSLQTLEPTLVIRESSGPSPE